MHPSFFKTLSASEELKFRQWARDNFDISKDAEEIWHPVVKSEWRKLRLAYLAALGEC